MKKPTPAQLAARERFAEMARSGAFKRKAKAAKKAKANPRKKTVSQKISQLVREGYPQKQAVAVALSEQRAGKVKATPRKRNPAGMSEAKTVRELKTVKQMREWFGSLTNDLTDAEVQYMKSQFITLGYGDFVPGQIPASVFYRAQIDATRLHPTVKRKRNPATGRKGSGTKLNPKPRTAKIAWSTPGGQREVMEVPIDFAFKEYIGNIQQDFFARKQKTKGVPFDALVVSEKSTGYKVGVVPRTLRSVFGDRAAAKQFVQDLTQQVGAEKFNAQIALKPKIA